MLEQHTYERLAKSEYEGQPSLVVYVVIASSASVNGNVVHFDVTEKGVKVLGLTSYEK